MTHCWWIFRSYTHPTYSEQWWLLIPTQPVCIFGIVQHDILDSLNMLISIEMPGIRSRDFSVPLFAPCPSHMRARDNVSVALVSYITAAGIVRSSLCVLVIAMFIRAGIVRACQSHTCQRNMYQSWNCQRLCQSIPSSPGLSETMSEPHLSEQHLLEPRLSETLSVNTFIARIIRD